MTIDKIFDIDYIHITPSFEQNLSCGNYSLGLINFLDFGIIMAHNTFKSNSPQYKALLILKVNIVTNILTFKKTKCAFVVNNVTYVIMRLMLGYTNGQQLDH